MNLPLDLTAEQNDYAIFLPALSTFYLMFVGRQRNALAEGKEWIPSERIPNHFTNGVESGNWLDPAGLWQYKWSLHSVGHAMLVKSKNEGMYRERNRDTSFMVGDSGGFQIGAGKWKGDWKSEDCPTASLRRERVLNWMEEHMEYGMGLDIPGWTDHGLCRDTKSGKFWKDMDNPPMVRSGWINGWQDAIAGTQINNEYFIKNRRGNCKFLNVLQGKWIGSSEEWYSRMKQYCDPKQYPGEHFNGWAMGDDHMCNIRLALERIVDMIDDDLLQKGKHDWMHFLGTSKLEWSIILTQVQRAIRKHVNPNFTVSYDCASPFLASVNGKIYSSYELNNNQGWKYNMSDALKEWKYASSSQPFDEACEELFGWWMGSPTTAGMKVNDFCVYKEGDVDMNGNIPRSSWDSFSYYLMMNHNVYTHIRSVQEANKLYDARESCPQLLWHQTESMDYLEDLIDLIIRSPKGKAYELLAQNSSFLKQMSDSRDGERGQMRLEGELADIIPPPIRRPAAPKTRKTQMKHVRPPENSALSDDWPLRPLAQAKRPRKITKPIDGLFE